MAATSTRRWLLTTGNSELRRDGSDLLAVYGPPKVGIPANNIRHLQRRQGPETFGSLQRANRARLDNRRPPVRQPTGSP